MKKLLFAAVLLMSGCCVCRDANGVSLEDYARVVGKTRANIAEIRSDIAALDYDSDLKKADLDLIDATLTLCDDTLAGKNAGGEQ